MATARRLEKRQYPERRLGGGAVGVVDGECPAAPARDIGEGVAMELNAVAIGSAPGTGVADAQLKADLRLIEDRLPREGEGLLHGIDNHDEVPAGAAAGNAFDNGGDVVDRREEIADQNRFVEAPDRRAGRKVVVDAVGIAHDRLSDLLGDL